MKVSSIRKTFRGIHKLSKHGKKVKRLKLSQDEALSLLAKFLSKGVA